MVFTPNAPRGVSLTFDDLRELTGGRTGNIDAACPLCGPRCKTPSNRVRRVLRIWDDGADFITYTCARCGESGYAKEEGTKRSAPRPRPAPVQAEPAPDKSDTSRFYWGLSVPAKGTLAEVYSRSRSCWVDLPTLRFLPAYNGRPPALIVPFGLPSEPEYGQLVVKDIQGVQLIYLKPDGSGKADVEVKKRSFGRCAGFPIPLAPTNDSLALTIAEGIENALSNYLNTGRGAWASGGASFLPKLADAVPDYVESVTIIVDNDPNGIVKSDELAERLLQRGIEVRLVRADSPERFSS
jgi:hypothetical protein